MIATSDSQGERLQANYKDCYPGLVIGGELLNLSLDFKLIMMIKLIYEYKNEQKMLTFIHSKWIIYRLNDGLIMKPFPFDLKLNDNNSCFNYFNEFNSWRSALRPYITLTYVLLKISAPGGLLSRLALYNYSFKSVFLLLTSQQYRWNWCNSHS